MKMEIGRHPFRLDEYMIRVTEFGLTEILPHHFQDAMVAAINDFVKTDPEVQILINEMTRKAFDSIDLLKVVTDAVKQKVEASAVEKGKH